MAKKNEGVNVGKVFGILVLLIVVFLVYKWAQKPETETPGTGAITPGTTAPTTGGGSTTPAAKKIDGNTVWVAKKPYPKSDYIQWIQSLYNSYTLQRNKLARYPTKHPTIKVDGIYGSETATAVNRYMGKYHTSWNEFKGRIDWYKSQL